ncbi:MAG TPA: hypothetical protein VMT15_09875 [Bryobacteraceae bacterium]|nr:hypothetical protein [Bryobacteraceae bacterium]
MNRNASGEDELSSNPNEVELYRQLIEQFYESSVDRHGINSAQARMLSRILSADLPPQAFDKTGK